MQALNNRTYMRNIIILIVFALFLVSTAESKTLKVDTITPSVTNGDLTLQLSGTGDLVLGSFSGVLKASAGVVVAGDVDLASEVTGILPIANGGTNSSTALTNDFVMVSSTGSIVEDSLISTTELSYLNNVTSNLQDQLDNFSVTPTTTEGDLILRGATEDERLPIGTSDYLLTSNGTTASWQPAPVSTTLSAKGDIQTFSTVNAALTVGTDGQFLIADSAETTGLKWSDTLQGKLNPVTDMASYTPTTQGFGTISSSEIYYSQIGDKITISGRFAAGTVTATEAQISLPDGLTIKTGLSVTTSGVYVRGNSGITNGGMVLITGGDSFINFSIADVFSSSSSAALAPANGNGVSVGAGEIVSFTAIVPVNELSSGLDAVVENRKWCEVKASGNDDDVLAANTEDIPFKTESIDNCGLWDNSGNTGSDTADAFTPTRDMSVSISGGLYFTGSPAVTVMLYGDGTALQSCGVAEGITNTVVFGCDYKLLSGVKYTIRTSVAGTLDSSNATFHHIHILERPSDNTVIVASISQKALKKDEDKYSESEVEWGLWNGEQLYRRCATVASDITTITTIATWATNLNPRGIITDLADRYIIMSQTEQGSSSNISAIRYQRTTGAVEGFGNGTYVIDAGVSFCMEYTK